MDYIKLESITLKYKNIPLFNNLNLKINKGEYVSIIGSNGSGKTTLAHILSGMIKNFTGNYFFDDALVTEEKLRLTVGILFQNPDNQLVASIVKNDIAFGLENRRVKSFLLMDKMIDEVLHKLNIFNLKNRNVNTLSGGQKQKVAIASILVLNFDVIILDEATSMLDPFSRNELMEIMQQLNDEGKTIIHITHHMEESKKADRIIVLDKGKIIADGKPKAIFKNKEIIKIANLT
ncbi:MAG: ATP-binding cassette domain-containing protein [Mycoplasmataceae bacterium]|nr:ATP-binding cassette domain-containing protein [Mycoplasmataceae bacterium]